jgi:hypothetical protein
MQRRNVVVIVSFAYAAYWTAILLHRLFAESMRPHFRVIPWLVGGILGLLCYAMATRRRWARALGLVVAAAGLVFWSLVGVWLYAFSGFSSRSGNPTLFSFAMGAGVLPQLLFSVALLVLLARPFVDDAHTEKNEEGGS